SPTFPETRTAADGSLIFPGINPWTSGLTAQLSENLFDNGLSIDRYKIANLREEQATVQALDNRDQVFLEIGQRFYQYSLDRKLLALQEDQFGILKKQFGIVSEGYQQGLRTRKDYLRFRSELNRFEIEYLRAKNTLQVSRQELLRLVGAPADSTASGLDFALDEKEPKLEKLAPLNLENHRQFKITSLNTAAQAIETRIVRRRRWPELSLTLGATYSANDYINGAFGFTEGDTLNWNAGLVLTYNILDWGIRARDAESAALTESITGNARTEQLLRTGEEITRLRLDYDQLAENFRLNRELLDLENTNLAAITRDYRQGQVQYLDYITSLRDLASARSQYYSTLYDLKKSQLTYRFHQGTLYEAIFD
ncbi:MAG: TolC family protein, partial [Proteobacteria bacterium]